MLQTTFLQYLIHIEKTGSMSIAAENLHVSQPALSSGIKTLEEQLGVKLLHRTNKGVSLTAEGLKVAEKAQELFRLMDDIETMFQQPEDSKFLLDDVIIYANPSYTPQLMTALTQKYSQANANNPLQIFHTTPDAEVNKLLASSTRTVILSILPEDYTLPPDISVTVLNQSQAYIMCAKNCPYFLPEQTSTTFKEIHALPFVIASTKYEFQTKLLAYLSAYGEPNIKAITPDTTSITAAVRNSSYLGFYNKLALSGNNNSGLRYLTISDAPVFKLCLLYNKHTSLFIIHELANLLKPLIN